MVKGFAKKKDKKKMPISLYPNKIAPVDFEGERENNTQTPVTSLPATFIPAPGGYQGKIAQAIPGSALQKHPSVDTPQIEIDPSIKAEIEDAVEQIVAADPGYFRGVSKIVALHGGPFGQVSSDDPSVIHLNVDRIKNEVKAKLGSFDTSNPEHREAFEAAVKHALVEVISHERGHVGDWDPEKGFPGGEGIAEQESRRMLQRIFPTGSIRGFCKRAAQTFSEGDMVQLVNDPERGMFKITGRTKERGNTTYYQVEHRLTPEQQKERMEYWDNAAHIDPNPAMYQYVPEDQLVLVQQEGTPSYPGKLGFPNSPAGGFGGGTTTKGSCLRGICKTAQYSSEMLGEWQLSLEGVEDSNGKKINMPEELPSLWQEILVRAYQEGGDQLVEMFNTHERAPNLTVVLPLQTGSEMEVHGVAEDEGLWVTLILGQRIIEKVREGDIKLVGYINQSVMHEYKHLMDRITKSEQWRSRSANERLSFTEEKQDIREELRGIPFEVRSYLDERYALLMSETSAIAAEVAEAVRELKEQGYDHPYIENTIINRTLELRRWAHTRGLELLLQKLIKEAYDKNEITKGTLEKEVVETLKQEPWWRRILRKFKIAKLVSLKKTAYGPDVKIEKVSDLSNVYHVTYKDKYIGTLIQNQETKDWGYGLHKWGPWVWGKYYTSAQVLQDLLDVAGIEPKHPKTASAQRKLIIGLDIDGVLCDLQRALFEIASKYIPLSEEDWDQYKIQDVEHGSDELKDKVFEEIYETKGIANAPVIPDAVDKVNELYDKGHRIVLITARPTNWEEQTKEWLHNVGLKFNKLFVGVQDKGAKAKEERVDVFVDDQPNNLEDVAEENIPAYAFEQPWNEGVDVPKIRDWKDVKASLTLDERMQLDKEIREVDNEALRKQLLIMLHRLESWSSPEMVNNLRQALDRARGFSNIKELPIFFPGPSEEREEIREQDMVEEPLPESNIRESDLPIFPPGPGEERGEIRERGVGEEWLPEYIRNTESLIRAVSLKYPVTLFKGWPKKYHAIEFDDKVLLVSVAPMRRTKKREQEDKTGHGNAAFIVPQIIDGEPWDQYLTHTSKGLVKEKLEKGEFSGEWIRRDDPKLLSMLRDLAGVSVAHLKGFCKTASTDSEELYENFLRHYWPTKRVQELKRIREEGYVKDKDIDWEVVQMDVWEEYTNEINDRLLEKGWDEEEIEGFLEKMDDLLMAKRGNLKGLVKTSWEEEPEKEDGETLEDWAEAAERAGISEEDWEETMDLIGGDFSSLTDNEIVRTIVRNLGEIKDTESSRNSPAERAQLAEDLRADGASEEEVSEEGISKLYEDTIKNLQKEIEGLENELIKRKSCSIKSFTKTAAPRWTTEEKNRLKKIYLKYRERKVPHHIIYKAIAELLDKSYLAVKQKLESMYDIEEDLQGMKFEHWDKCKIDQMIQDLYRSGQPINRLGLPAALMYQITNHSMPKAQTCGFPVYYDSFDNAMASNILAVGFERVGDKLTEKPISTLEDAIKFYRRQEKQAHAWTPQEIVALFKDAHAAGLPLTYSFFRSHPAIYMPLLGVGRSLEGLRDSIKRAGRSWSDMVMEAAPEYATLYGDNGRLRDTTEEIRIRRFLELNNVPFRRATFADKIEVTDPELQEMGYRHFIPDFFILDGNGQQIAIVEVFGSVADSGAANTSQIYREKKEAKQKFYPTLPYRFIAINNNTEGVELSDVVLNEKFADFIQR